MNYNSVNPRSTDHRGSTKRPIISEALKNLNAERAYILFHSADKVRAARLVQPAWELILQGYYGLPLSAEDLRTAEEILLRAGKELRQ